MRTGTPQQMRTARNAVATAYDTLVPDFSGQWTEFIANVLDGKLDAHPVVQAALIAVQATEKPFVVDTPTGSPETEALIARMFALRPGEPGLTDEQFKLRRQLGSQLRRLEKAANPPPPSQSTLNVRVERYLAQTGNPDSIKTHAALHNLQLEVLRSCGVEPAPLPVEPAPGTKAAIPTAKAPV